MVSFFIGRMTSANIARKKKKDLINKAMLQLCEHCLDPFLLQSIKPQNVFASFNFFPWFLLLRELPEFQEPDGSSHILHLGASFDVLLSGQASFKNIRLYRCGAPSLASFKGLFFVHLLDSQSFRLCYLGV